MALLDDINRQLMTANTPLLGFAQGLLQSAGPSTTPVSNAQALAQGLQGFKQARQQLAEQEQQARQNQLREIMLAIEFAKLRASMQPQGISALDDQKLQLERDKLGLQKQKLNQDMKIAQQKLSGKDKFEKKDLITLNDKVSKLTADARQIHASAKSLEGLEERATPAAKLAAVFKFMKANDPTSTVRTEEQGQVYAAQGAMRGFANKINQLLGEGALDEKGFQDLVETAKTMANEASESADSEVESFLNVFPGLTRGQYSRLKGRIPELFEIKPLPTTSSNVMTLSDGTKVKRVN